MDSETKSRSNKKWTRPVINDRSEKLVSRADLLIAQIKYSNIRCNDPDTCSQLITHYTRLDQGVKVNPVLLSTDFFRAQSP